MKHDKVLEQFKGTELEWRRIGSGDGMLHEFIKGRKIVNIVQGKLNGRFGQLIIVYWKKVDCAVRKEIV